MNIELYAIEKNSKVLETKVFEVSDVLFQNLAGSEFSVLGVSRKTSVNLDDEVVEIKLVLLSPFVRKALTDYLKDLLIEILENSLNKMGNSPSKEEYQEYTKDLKYFPKLIKCLENDKYTHLYRMG